MARTPKPSGRKKAGPRLRRNNSKKVEKEHRILIVSEGVVTEPTYFNRLQKELGRESNVSLTVLPNKKGNPSSWDPDPKAVVKYCIDEWTKDKAKWANRKGADVKPYCAAYAVVDLDHRGKVSAKTGQSRIDEAVQLAKENCVSLIVSNSSFECWLLWHHLQVLPPDPDSLLNSCAQNGLMEGKLPSHDFPVGEYQSAAERADRHKRVEIGEVGPFPSTAMPRLLEGIGLLETTRPLDS